MIIIVFLTLYMQISFVLMYDYYSCISGFELKGNLKPCNLYHP